jgi:DNA-binding MarR family transcriptional regulator
LVCVSSQNQKYGTDKRRENISFARLGLGVQMIKNSRKPNGNFELAEAPSYLIRRCQQFYGELYAREAGAQELTKQQFTVLAALEHNEGVSQTALVEMTGIDRSTLAEMVRRMLEKGLLSRERTEEDARANAVAITQNGRKALRSARNAADRAERALLDALPPAERTRFIKSLAAIASAAATVMDGQQAEAPPRRRGKRKS